MAFESSQGITFTFDGAAYKATSVSVSKSQGEFDVSTTDIALGGFRRLRAGKIKTIDIKVDWIGTTLPSVKTVGNWSIAGDNLGAGASGKALCTGLSISGEAGGVYRGSATFKVSKD
jgi:hypothetical protein